MISNYPTKYDFGYPESAEKHPFTTNYTVEPSEGYTDEEKGLFRQLVNSNVVQALYTILIQMDYLGISFGEKDAEYVAKSYCQGAEGK